MSTFFVKMADGRRDSTRKTTDQYGGGGYDECAKMCRPGETVDGPRECPYPGCRGGADARPPCALCYE